MYPVYEQRIAINCFAYHDLVRSANAKRTLKKLCTTFLCLFEMKLLSKISSYIKLTYVLCPACITLFSGNL